MHISTREQGMSFFQYRSFRLLIRASHCLDFNAEAHLLRSPGDVFRRSCCGVFVDQLLKHLARRVELVQVVLEYGHLLELIEESFPLTQLFILSQAPLEQLTKQRTVEYIFIIETSLNRERRTVEKEAARTLILDQKRDVKY
jgi:hypothetical protein